MNNIRAAILKTANLLESKPALWDFNSCTIPDCGTPGCALGWIGAHLGVNANKGIHHATDLIGVRGPAHFYGRMRGLNVPGFDWDSIPAVVMALRQYADKYHPATVRTGMPESVRALFDVQPSRSHA